MIVLFDFDGTLVDSEPGIVATWHHTLAAVGLPDRTDQQLRAHIGPALIDIAASLSDDQAMQRRLFATYRAAYETLGFAGVRTFDGVESMLTSLRSNGHRLAVATSKTESIADDMLERLGLRRHFDAVAGAHGDGSRRHKHEVIAHVMAHLPADRAMMVGDRIHDLEGARRQGLDCIGALWGYGTPEELAGAAALAAAPSDVVDVIERVSATAP